MRAKIEGTFLEFIYIPSAGREHWLLADRWEGAGMLTLASLVLNEHHYQAFADLFC